MEPKSNSNPGPNSSTPPSANPPPTENEILWQHPSPQTTKMHEFMQLVNRKYGVELAEYEELWEWSVGNLEAFWGEVWAFVGVKAERVWDVVLPGGENAALFPRPDFFQGALLNFAENLLYPANVEIDPKSTAIIEANEIGHTAISWEELRERVRVLSNTMRSHGIKPSDRIAGFLGNHANAVIAMLASASIGAIWTCVSPDTGVTAVLERLIQIEPRIFFADNAVRYNGKVWSSEAKVKDIVAGLKGLEHVVVFETVEGMDVDFVEGGNGTKSWTLDRFLKSNTTLIGPLIFTPLPPSHPLYILSSSGTTGPPKPIVHSAAGTLLQHKKEHLLHCSLLPHHILFYYTTTTWMMWHWLVSALSLGTTIVLYDGSPFYPSSTLTLLLLIQDLKITHFGTSAKYLSILEQKPFYPLLPSSSSSSSNANPKPSPSPTPQQPLNLSSLLAIYSTGSPLSPSTFKYIYTAFPSSLCLSSITGGTDIISLFGAPCPLVPVRAGEIQCLGLGMAVQAYSLDGSPVPDGEEGDLVCVKPFPSQPTTFWSMDRVDDTRTTATTTGTRDGAAAVQNGLTPTPRTAGDKKYHSAYFTTFPPVWHHGDYIRIAPSFSPRSRGLIMLGRSDGVLKPAGVRFGSAEIYNLLLAHFSAEVEDAVCVGRRREGVDVDEVVVLFVKMVGGVKFDGGDGKEGGLAGKIKEVVKRELSARHVPAVVDECFEIPVTGNGKKVELAVKHILNNRPVKVGASVANKECLEWYREWAATH